jgi:hypothetical protein
MALNLLRVAGSRKIDAAALLLLGRRKRRPYNDKT